MFKSSIEFFYIVNQKLHVYFHSYFTRDWTGVGSQWLNTNDFDFIIWRYEDVRGRLFRITSTDGCHMVISANTLDFLHLSAPTDQNSTTGTILPATFLWKDLFMSECEKMINLH